VTAPAAGFVLPPYPYDRLAELTRSAAERFDGSGGLVDCSVGTPTDPPPPVALAALAGSGTERGYPASIGSMAYREAAAGWMARRFGVAVDPATEVAACVGTKELVASTAQYLRLRAPDRDTVLYPAISYPTYAMGAILAGCRPVAVPELPSGGPDLEAVDPADADRALLLWVNSPSNPTGRLTDLGRVAAWGRAHRVPVFSDECYAEFTWAGPPQTILASGVDGVVAVHSLSKRSNLAGVRAGFLAGDPELVGFLREIRKHAGLMVPGPVQAAAAAALADDTHVEEQRERYRERLERLRALFADVGLPAPFPDGAFYLWVPVPDSLPGGGWGLTAALADQGGLVVSPGEFYGDGGAGYVRVAAVQPTDRIDRVGERLSGVDLAHR
jgi:succinyldiaminopimelate transaminase